MPRGRIITEKAQLEILSSSPKRIRKGSRYFSLLALVSKEDRKQGRPEKDDEKHKEAKLRKAEATRIKESSYAVGKAPENLTERQKETLSMIQTQTPRYYRAYDMKETLRNILKMTDPEEDEIALKKWRWRASHSRIDSFKENQQNEEYILNTIKYGLSNARIEATNNKIKLVIRRSYGFRNIQSMLDMIYLCCSGLVIPLPGRYYPKVPEVA